jgi:hypothetical protein
MLNKISDKMKKNLSLFFAVLCMAVLSSCKKDYSCKAVSAAGAESVFKCENCSKKDVEAYEADILAEGYTSATCEK